MTMKVKARKVFAILLALVMCIGLIPMFTITANAKGGGTTNFYYPIDHVDIAKDDGATELAVPSSATVIVTYANGDTKTLYKNGTSTGNDGASQWRFVGLKSDSYIGTANKDNDKNGANRAVSVYISYVVNGKTYEYTLSNWEGLRAGIYNCPGQEGLDIAVLGSSKTDYYYYQVVYEYYTDDSKDGTESGNIQQVEETSVSLSPAATKAYSENTYTFDSAKSDSYTNVSLAASKNNPNNPIVIKLVYVRTAPAPQTGSLKISKTVTGEGADTNKEFEFTVTWKDANGGNHSSTYKLKDGESETIADLPAGTTYTVTEAEADNYTSTSTGATGTIEAGKTSEAKFVNTYSAPEENKFSFTIKKTVVKDGNIAPGEETFNFIVATTFKDPTDEQILARPTITTSGEGTWSLDVEVTADEDVDKLYVWEVDDGADGWAYQAEFYEVTKNGYQQGIISKGMFFPLKNTYAGIHFVNRYNKSEVIPKPEYGSVTVKKFVVGNLAPEEKGETVAYYFNLKLLDENGNAVAGEISQQITGGNKMALKVSTAGYDFSLKKDESVTFSDIPVGTKIQVTEISTGDFTTDVTVGTETERDTDRYTYTVVKRDTPKAIQFVNDYGDATGSLTVSKTVSGDGADKKKAFTFTVYVFNGDAPLEGTFGDMVFEKEGKATFTLTDGQSVKATGLPVGYTYYVQETDNDGYTATAKVNGESYDVGKEAGVEGIIESDSLDAVVEFKNHKDADPKPKDPSNETPKTGDESGIALWGIIACVALLGITTLVFGKKFFRR